MDENPAGASPDEVRALRDETDRRVQALLAGLSPVTAVDGPEGVCDA